MRASARRIFIVATACLCLGSAGAFGQTPPPPPTAASRSRPSRVIFTLYSGVSRRGYEPTATLGNSATTASSASAITPSPSRE